MDVWLGNWGSGCVVEWAGRGQKVVGMRINKYIGVDIDTYMDVHINTYMGVYINNTWICT